MRSRAVVALVAVAGTSGLRGSCPASCLTTVENPASRERGGFWPSFRPSSTFSTSKWIKSHTPRPASEALSAPVESWGACSGVVSRDGRNTSLDSGGCVGIVGSGEEGAGAASAIGQTSAIHGVAGQRVEHPCRSPGGRCVPVCGDELDQRLQGVPQRRRSQVRPTVGSARGARD